MKRTYRIYVRLGLLISILVALILPIGYFAVSYTYLTGALETEADVNAGIISGIISANPELWSFEQMRLQELLSQRLKSGHAETRRIRDLHHLLVAESAYELSPPVITRSFELLDAGVPVGSIEISRSLLPILIVTGIVALFGMSIGVAMFFLLWKLAFSGMILAERQRLDEAGRESDEKLQAIVAASNSGIILLTMDGVIEFANERMAEMFGMEHQELINTSYFEHLQESEKLDAFAQVQRLKSGEIETSVSGRRYTRKDGSFFWGHLSAKRLEHLDGSMRGLVVIITDISEHKENEELLRDREQKFRAVFDQNFHLAGLLDVTGRLTEINSTALQFAGVESSDVLGKLFWDTPWWSHSPEQQEKVHQAIIDALNGEFVNFEATHPAEDGTLHYIDFSIRPILDESGTVTFLVPEGRDITDRKNAAEKHLNLERKLLHSQKLESLGILSGGIAHDFNNLLQAILGNLDLALKVIPEEAASRKNIFHAIKAGQHAARLTNMMLAYSGKGTFVVNRLNLSLLVQENAAMLSAAIPKTVILIQQLDHTLPTIMADAGQIQQVVMNLLTNASEAIGDESGSIIISTGVGEFDQETVNRSRLEEKMPPGRYVWIETSDTGCGMDEQTLCKIFDPFFTTKFTGRGLGMSAVLGIIRAHKGAFLVESTPGAGTTIRVLFPVADLSEVEHAVTSSATQESRESGDRHIGVILIVDDEQMIREVCEAMLAELGFETLTASSGEEAVGIFRELGENIGLVVLDQSMPHMDGFTTFQELRRIRPSVKVLLASGYSEQEVSERFTGMGPDGFIQKPFSLSGLADEVRRVLR